MDDVVYWPTICGNSSKFWVFWDPELTVNTTEPQLSLCFTHTVLVWIPFVYIVVASAIYIPFLHIYSYPMRRNAKHSALNLGKSVITLFLAFVYSLDFFKAIADALEGKNPPPALWQSAILYVLMMLLVCSLNHWTFLRHVHSSGVLFCFWLLLLVCGFPTLFSHAWDNDQFEDSFRAVTFFVSYTLILIQFVLHIWSDKGAYPRLRLGEETPFLQENKKYFKNSSRKPCPEGRSSFLSWITWWWISPLVVAGYRKPIVFDDLSDIMKEETAEYMCETLTREWNKELLKMKGDSSDQQAISGDNPLYQREKRMSYKSGEDTVEHVETEKIDINSGDKSKPSLLMAVTRTVFGVYFAAGIFNLINIIMQFTSPILLDSLIAFVQTNDKLIWHGYFLAALLFITTIFKSLFALQYFQGCALTGVRLRVALISAIYRKSLRLTPAARQGSTTGEIVNLMSVDAQRFQEAPSYLHQFWSAPITIAVAIVFLWQQLGPSVLAGLAVMILMIPLNGWVAALARRLQVKQMGLKDKRIKIMNEILSGIKVLKLYAWETCFEDKVHEIRDKEVHNLKLSAYLNAASSLTFFSAPYLVALSTFAVYVLSSDENVLTPQKAFVSLTLFNILNFPLMMLPATIAFGVQSWVSLKRIRKFLLEDEIDKKSVTHDATEADALNFRGASFSWTDVKNPTLKDINLNVPVGSLVALVGQVGSAKSSLVSAALGEMIRTDGSVNLKGEVAYVPQQAWIQNLSVRDNITFGRKYNESFYNEVVEACALPEDFKILPGGDKTEIGEKGINLSGGQKQRISLARAVYQDSDVYFLDDPLSAVDVHVGKHIFDRVVGPQGLLNTKTRILVTNQITYLPQVDHVICMADGTISEQGAYQELLDHLGPFAEFINQYLIKEEERMDSDEESDDPEKDVQRKIRALFARRQEKASQIKADLRRRISVLSGTEDSETEPGYSSSGHDKRRRSGAKRQRSRQKSTSDAEKAPVVKKKQNLTEEEHEETGAVSLAVLMAYIRAIGAKWSLALLFSYTLYMASQVNLRPRTKSRHMCKRCIHGCEAVSKHRRHIPAPMPDLHICTDFLKIQQQSDNTPDPYMADSEQSSSGEYNQSDAEVFVPDSMSTSSSEGYINEAFDHESLRSEEGDFDTPLPEDFDPEKRIEEDMLEESQHRGVDPLYRSPALKRVKASFFLSDLKARTDSTSASNDNLFPNSEMDPRSPRSIRLGFFFSSGASSARSSFADLIDSHPASPRKPPAEPFAFGDVSATFLPPHCVLDPESDALASSMECLDIDPSSASKSYTVLSPDSLFRQYKANDSVFSDSGSVAKTSADISPQFKPEIEPVTHVDSDSSLPVSRPKLYRLRSNSSDSNHASNRSFESITDSLKHRARRAARKRPVWSHFGYRLRRRMSEPIILALEH